MSTYHRAIWFKFTQ